VYHLYPYIATSLMYTNYVLYADVTQIQFYLSNIKFQNWIVEFIRHNKYSCYLSA